MLFFVSVSDEEDETSAANGGHRLPRSLGEPLTPPQNFSQTSFLFPSIYFRRYFFVFEM